MRDGSANAFRLIHQRHIIHILSFSSFGPSSLATLHLCILSLYAKSNPKPFIQLLYFVTISAHAAWGSLAVEKSMHSSRAAFSSLQTQQGLGFDAFSVGLPAGLFEEARLLMVEESAAREVVLICRLGCRGELKGGRTG